MYHMIDFYETDTIKTKHCEVTAVGFYSMCQFWDSVVCMLHFDVMLPFGLKSQVRRAARAARGVKSFIHVVILQVGTCIQEYNDMFTVDMLNITSPRYIFFSCEHRSSHLFEPLLRLLVMAVDIPVSNQMTIPIHFALAPEITPWTLNDILYPLGLEIFDACEVNDWIIPLKTGLATHLLPAIETIPQHWTPWDDEIQEEFRYHLVLGDRQLYQTVQATADEIGMQIYLGAPGGSAALMQYQ